MGGCASSMEPEIHDSHQDGNKPDSLPRMQSSKLPTLTDADLTLGPKIREDDLEQAVKRIFDKYDLDKDEILSIDEVAALLKGSFKYNREVTAKEVEDFTVVLTGQSGSKVERRHFIRWYRQIYC